MKMTLDKVAIAAIFIAITVLSLQASALVQLPAQVAQFLPYVMFIAAVSGLYILYKFLAKNKAPFGTR